MFAKIRVLAFIAAFFATPTAAATALTVTTFNIKFYGKDKTNSLDDDRDATIREFLEISGIDSDVIAFQEILDTLSLERHVLQDRYSCLTYDHSSSRHQHVTLCHKPKFGFRIDDNDNNYAWEDVAMSTLRPALHGVLTDAQGNDIAHIVAVHLKAMPQDSSRRLAQTEIMADNINDRGNRLPVIVLGDFNSYYDDIERMEDIYEDNGISLAPIANPYDYTYRTDRYRSKLDWIWITPDIEVVTQPQVDGPCNPDKGGSDFGNLDFYNDNVSDHCPVTVSLEVNP